MINFLTKDNHYSPRFVNDYSLKEMLSIYS